MIVVNLASGKSLFTAEPTSMFQTAALAAVKLSLTTMAADN